MKKMVPTLLIFLVFSRCIKLGGRCEEAVDIRSSGVGLTIMDRNTGRYVYAEEDPLLAIEDFTVTDENGDAVDTYFYKAVVSTFETPYYKVRVPLFQLGSDDAAYSSELCKKYYIRYAEGDRDTMAICFKVADQKCGGYFQKLNISFASGALYSGTDVFAEMRVSKRSQ